MRRWLIVLLLFSLVFVVASVDVDNFYVKDSYVYSDEIVGNVSLIIEGENYDEKISLSDGRDIELGDFLEMTGADYECFPFDCLMGYSSSDGADQKVIPILPGEDKYFGFLLEGNNIAVTSIAFSIDSNFGVGEKLPLSIEFFEDENWDFSSFSENDYLSKNWGCSSGYGQVLGEDLVGTSYYCEKISLSENSGKLKVGAKVSGGSGSLRMEIYSDGGIGSSHCDFDPSAGDIDCSVNPLDGDVFYAGDYWVCVGSDVNTNYKIYEENDEEHCGFPYDAGPSSSVKDYAIFAQGLKYAGSNDIGEVDFEGKVDLANDIIQERYEGDCSDGCILPLKVSGVSQDFKIYDVNLGYTTDSMTRSSNLIYDLNKIPAKVDFNGTLDLGFFNMVVLEDGEYYAELSGEDVFSVDVELLPAPLIKSVYPLDPPAGIPVTFYANVDFDGNKSLTYQWDFGEGENISYSEVPQMSHTYNDLKSYTLSLSVSAGGNLTHKKDFLVSTVSPKDAIVDLLDSKNEDLAAVKVDILKLNAWYEKDLLNILEISNFEQDLLRLERKKNDSFDAEDFRDVAVELYALNTPIFFGFNNFEAPFFMTEASDIKTEPISIFSGGITDIDESAYDDAIFLWQNENIDANIKKNSFFATYTNGEQNDFLTSYKISVTSKWNKDSYLVINRPIDDLYFNKGVVAKKIADYTLIILGAGETKDIEFYYKDDAPVIFFVSPSLSSLIVGSEINSDCNYNLVCDESLGENTENCRSDCKPTGKAFTIFILLVLLLLVVYTIFQVWYKRNYEKYLFRDGTQLYNLLMYISNARARGIKDKVIVKDLKSRGWSSERVDYAIKKSNGKSVKMIEIIPIEKISAAFRNFKSRRAFKSKSKVISPVNPQNEIPKQIPSRYSNRENVPRRKFR